MLGKPGKGGEQTLSLHIRKICERATLRKKRVPNWWDTIAINP